MVLHFQCCGGEHYWGVYGGQATIVIPTVSEPVVNLVGVGADQNVTLTWDVPGNDGGAPLTGYRVDVTVLDAPAELTGLESHCGGVWFN